MAKFSGKIGFAKSEETSPGVYEESIQELQYTGDVLSSNIRYEKGESINDNLIISNRISVVSDGFLIANLGSMRYIDWNGVKYKISSAIIQRPRVVLSIGEVYHG